MLKRILVAAMLTSMPPLFAAEDPVALAIRAADQAAGASGAKASACTLLAAARDAKSGMESRDRKVMLEQIAGKLREGDVSMLRARGDAARMGLYGFQKNEQQALKFYLKAANAGSQEAGYNAALMIYQQARYQPDQATALKILDVLKKSSIADYNVKGVVSAQAHYIAAQIHEAGLSGKKNISDAFLHYRVSARNEYVPGIYNYLRLLSGAMHSLTSDQQQAAIREMRVMTSRWKWSMPDIMRLTGDLYAAGWMQDKSDFMAQYHWRISWLMDDNGHRQSQVELFQSRIRKMAPEMEKRLDEAVAAALRNNAARSAQTKLKFADLCS